MWVYFQAFYSVALIYVSVLVSVPYCFDYYSLVVQFEVRNQDTPSSGVFSRLLWLYSGSFVFPYKFQNYLFWFCENCYGQDNKDCIKSVDCLGYIDILTTLFLLIHDIISFHFCHLHFLSLTVFSFSVLQSSKYRSFTSLIRFMLKQLLMQL